jgi:hypothetical protein
MYYAQITGVIASDIKDDTKVKGRCLTKISYSFNGNKFYTTIFFDNSTYDNAKKFLKKGQELFVSGLINKNVNIKDKVKYTNELLFVDYFRIVRCDNQIMGSVRDGLSKDIKEIHNSEDRFEVIQDASESNKNEKLDKESKDQSKDNEVNDSNNTINEDLLNEF